MKNKQLTLAAIRHAFWFTASLQHLPTHFTTPHFRPCWTIAFPTLNIRSKSIDAPCFNHHPVVQRWLNVLLYSVKGLLSCCLTFFDATFSMRRILFNSFIAFSLCCLLPFTLAAQPCKPVNKISSSLYNGFSTAGQSTTMELRAERDGTSLTNTIYGYGCVYTAHTNINLNVRIL